MKYIITIFLFFITINCHAFGFNFGYNFGGKKTNGGYIDMVPIPSLTGTGSFGSKDTGTTTNSVFTFSVGGTDGIEAAILTVTNQTGTAFSEASRTCAANPFDLALLGTCTITVQFAPTAGTSYAGFVNYSAPNVPKYSIGLSGIGVAVGDTTPNAFTFTDQTGVALNTLITGTPVQITGIDTATAVTASNGSAAICTGSTLGTCGSYSTSPGNVVNNQYVSPQNTSSASNSTAVNTLVTIGGVSDTFTSTTTGTLTMYATSGGPLGSFVEVGNVSGREFVGQIVASGTHLVKRIKIKINTVVGTISSKNYEARIYTRNGTALDVLLGASTAVNGSTLSAGNWVTFDFSTPVSITTGNVFTISAGDAVADASNYITVKYSATDVDSAYSAYTRWALAKTVAGGGAGDIEYEIYE